MPGLGVQWTETILVPRNCLGKAEWRGWVGWALGYWEGVDSFPRGALPHTFSFMAPSSDKK